MKQSKEELIKKQIHRLISFGMDAQYVEAAIDILDIIWMAGKIHQIDDQMNKINDLLTPIS